MKLLSIITLAAAVSLSACATDLTPLGPSSVRTVTDDQPTEPATVSVRQTCTTDDLGIYNPETDLCEPAPPPPSTTPNTCLEDDLGIYNPETDLCEPL